MPETMAHKMAIHARLTQSAALSQQKLLADLKETKNLLIGNTQKKIQLVQETGAVKFMVDQVHAISAELQVAISQIDLDESSILAKLQVLNELAVIVGAVAGAGEAALASMLQCQTTIMLLASISIVHPMARKTIREYTSISRYINTKCLPSLVRALRNHLVILGDFAWGHMWGVGIETKPMNGNTTAGTPIKGKSLIYAGMEDEAIAGDTRLHGLQQSAMDVLTGIFSPRSLNIYAPILLETCSPLAVLPLYQIFAHLTVTGWQREALTEIPPLERNYGPDHSVPIIDRLADIINRKDTNVKLKQAALDFLGALCKDSNDNSVQALIALKVSTESAPSAETPFFSDLLVSRSPGIPTSAACCAARIVYALAPGGIFSVFRSNMAFFNTLIQLLDQTVEEKIRICFVISHLMAEDVDAQAKASDSPAMTKIISILKNIEMDTATKSETESVKARLLEACLIALASLSYYQQSPKTMIADANVFPIILKALSHESYGVRAAACQLTRALSRSIAVLRTTLVDSGIAEQIVDLLKVEADKLIAFSELEREFFGTGITRRDTVLIAASAALCNLITEFSPMQETLTGKGGIELLVRLSESSSEPTRVNALRGFRNMLYKNDFRTKVRVMEALTWPALHRAIVDPSSTDLQEQGLALLRNICCEGSEQEIELVFDGFGEGPLFEVIEQHLENKDQDCLEQLMFVLYNICLGNEKHREAILTRPAVCLGMKKALTHRELLVKIPTIGCFINLIETNDRTRRPRREVLTRLKPLLLESTLQSLTFDPSFDVKDKSARLLGYLEGAGTTSR